MICTCASVGVFSTRVHYHQCCWPGGCRNYSSDAQSDLQPPATVSCGTRHRLTHWRRPATSYTSR